MAGNLALGHHNGLSREHLELGKELMETCYQMYARMPTGLSPEIAYFSTAEGSDDIIVKVSDVRRGMYTRLNRFPGNGVATDPMTVFFLYF